ncbi:Mo-dependent nitrogenase C-terminal domain-containing protein [Spirulina sp. 06S082]|uniref:Mo-dependent nitrogenase C-terminal domain-containing protein n=1 Tax=Spirulina sp. 06S082 TaxID=3110248 RepID=UPI002B1E90D9|nr:Mo-dependent nitrogenase C-terminal domain-containing protein [Spirulina sp. 06S082]MEA5468586.1 Mo-dependent nitrogenase C-terminal domain-containing protein [Spirulina sp. 06S082]
MLNPNIVSNALGVLSFPIRTSLSSDFRTFDLYHPLRQWLNQLEIKSSAIAHSICRTIPAQCPFERKIKVFGRTVVEIPPLCKLNPVYEEVVYLRFRALCYLADCCGEDIQNYC